MALTPEDITEYKECFAILDKDSDNFLTEAEVKAVVKIVQPAMDNKEYDKFKEMGPIGAKTDEATFRKAMVTKSTAPYNKEQLLAAFKVFDAENKGKIGLDEMTPILEILGEHLIDENHRANLLKKMFKDGAKEVQIETFVDWMLS